jgi:UDP-N-acetylmuramate dehydrogenase
MKLLKNKSLKTLNTFGFDVKAKQFVEIESKEDLNQFLKSKKEFFILGGGSNILITKDLDTIVLHINTKGIDIVQQTESHVFIKAEAGENWHQFVLWCIAHNYGGLENLSLIPGNVGTAPLQNIGAYGVELKDTFYELEAQNIENNVTKIFTKKDCDFGYRNSVFKKQLKGKYIITGVTFKLTKKDHSLNSSYGAIQSELDKTHCIEHSIKDISNAVIAIRRRKLPDPQELGNSGSFFKNPIISIKKFEKLVKKFPDIPNYKVSKEEIKIPAGWLVEHCGMKGVRFGDAGVHKNQALVLVNYGTATGIEILELANKIQKIVKTTFDIALEPEVNII